MQKIVIITILILAPCGVLAQGNWQFRQENNAVSVQGECIGRQIQLDFFARELDVDSAHSEKVSCENGKFDLTIDLGKTNLPEGNYIVAVDSEKSQNIVTLSRKTKVMKKSSDKPLLQPQVEIVADPETKFLGAFVSLQQSILDMREWLDQTSYPEILKSSIGLGLDGMDLAVSKVSDLVLSLQGTRDVVVEKVPEKAPEKTVEAQMAVVPDVATEPIATADNAVKLESVIVPEVSDTKNVPTIDVADSALTVDNTTIAQ